MGLLPTKSSRRFAEGGQMDYNMGGYRPLGSSGTGAAQMAGNALAQNLPPLAVPYIHVKRADLDGIRSAAAAQSQEQADALKEQWAKVRDMALKDAPMSKAATQKVADSYDAFMGRFAQKFAENRMYLNSQANIAEMNQDFARSMKLGDIRGYVNGFANSNKMLTDVGNERQEYGAYTTAGRRLNRSYKSVIQNYQENGQASTDPLDLVVRNGKEGDAYTELDKLLTLPTSTSGGEFADVGVENLRGAAPGDRYTVGRSGGSTTTSNLPRLSELRATMLGYSTKDKKTGKVTNHESDWRKSFSEQAVYGLEEPRLTKYDNAPLQAWETIKLTVLDPQTGQPVEVEVKGQDPQNPDDPARNTPFAGRSRRELLQYAENNPVGSNGTTVRQLEFNRGQLAEREVRGLLAERLGLKLVNGTISKAGMSASRIAPTAAEKAAKEAGDGGTSVAGAAGGASPAFPLNSTTGYAVLSKDGRAMETETRDAAGKVTKVPMRLNPAVSVVSGAEGMDKLLQDLIRTDGYTVGDNKEQKELSRPRTLANVPVSQAVYHLTPAGIRQIQGGNQFGFLAKANNYRFISQDGTLTWAATDANSGVAGREQVLAQIKVENDELVAKRVVLGPVRYGQQMESLRIRAQREGIIPYITATVATSENVLKDASRPSGKQDGDKHVGPFGYFDKSTKKAVRPDQFLGYAFNDTRKLLSQLGWEEMSDKDAEDAGVSDLNGKMNNGLAGSMFKTKMLIPAPNLQFNSTGKVANQNVANVEAEKRRAAPEEAQQGIITGSWKP